MGRQRSGDRGNDVHYRPARIRDGDQDLAWVPATTVRGRWIWWDSATSSRLGSGSRHRLGDERLEDRRLGRCPVGSRSGVSYVASYRGATGHCRQRCPAEDSSHRRTSLHCGRLPTLGFTRTHPRSPPRRPRPVSASMSFLWSRLSSWSCRSRASSMAAALIRTQCSRSTRSTFAPGRPGKRQESPTGDGTPGEDHGIASRSHRCRLLGAKSGA